MILVDPDIHAYTRGAALMKDARWSGAQPMPSHRAGSCKLLLLRLHDVAGCSGRVASTSCFQLGTVFQ